MDLHGDRHHLPLNTYHPFLMTTCLAPRTQEIVRVSPKGWRTSPITSHAVKSACQPKGRRTSFGLTIDNVLSTSHEVKSACQPKGWRTSFGLTSAKVQHSHCGSRMFVGFFSKKFLGVLRCCSVAVPKQLLPKSQTNSISIYINIYIDIEVFLVWGERLFENCNTATSATKRVSLCPDVSDFLDSLRRLIFQPSQPLIHRIKIT